MARFSLKDMVAEHDSNALGGLRSLDIEETHPTSNTTAAGDSSQVHVGGIGGWTASMTLVSDNAAGANQTLRAGDSVAFAGYAESDASGKTYYSGTATVTSHKPQSGSYDGEATTEYQLQGNGDLTKAVVA